MDRSQSKCLREEIKFYLNSLTKLSIAIHSYRNRIFHASASNEQQDKDSLNETASTAGGNVEGVPSGTPGRGERNKENESAAAQLSSSSPPSRSLVSRILARARSPNDLLDHTEPL